MRRRSSFMTASSSLCPAPSTFAGRTITIGNLSKKAAAACSARHLLFPYSDTGRHSSVSRNGFLSRAGPAAAMLET